MNKTVHIMVLLLIAAVFSETTYSMKNLLKFSKNVQNLFELCTEDEPI